MMNEIQLPHDLRERVYRELEPGERIQWLDMPVPRFFTPRAIHAVLFGIPWTTISIFWTAIAAHGTLKSGGLGLSIIFPLVGVPFILIGIGLLTSPLWEYRKALRTVYVITDLRAITFEGGRTMTIRSYPPNRLGDVHRKEKKDGVGDVIIERHILQSEDDHFEDRGFLRIRDAGTVEAMLRKMAEKGPGNQHGALIHKKPV